MVAVIYKKFINKKIKILVSVHGTDVNGIKGFFGKRLIKYVLNNIDGLTVVSDALKNDMVRLGYKKEVFIFDKSPSRKGESL